MVDFPVLIGLIINNKEGGWGNIGLSGLVFSLGGSWTLRIFRGPWS